MSETIYQSQTPEDIVPNAEPLGSAEAEILNAMERDLEQPFGYPYMREVTVEETRHIKMAYPTLTGPWDNPTDAPEDK